MCAGRYSKENYIVAYPVLIGMADSASACAVCNYVETIDHLWDFLQFDIQTQSLSIA